VIFGAGCLAEVPGESARLGSRVLLVAGRSQTEAARALEAALGDAAAAAIVGVRQHVPLEDAEEARRVAKEARADCIVALGGGSAVGLAKAIALETPLPILAVPTTYAGSELTPIWGITDERGKTTGSDPAVAPRTVVYDPELTVDLPVPTSVASGLNAAAHCVEAFWTERANPVTEAVAEDGLRALARALRAVASSPRDMRARSEALQGAWLAGFALATAGTGLHHKLCHVLGGSFGLPHAETHAVLLPHVAALVLPDAAWAAPRIARALGTDDAVDGLFALARELGAPSGLGELGFSEQDVDEAARLGATAAPAHPRPVSADELRGLLQRAR
jgi:alcohol dehydrogenase class IV